VQHEPRATSQFDRLGHHGATDGVVSDDPGHGNHEGVVVTVARSVVHNGSFIVEDPFPHEGAKVYRVMVTPKKGRINPSYGTVVTHLSLEDWCDMKGWKLVQHYSGDRWALPSEKTDLF
jgi:hypothetical protein